MPSFGTSVINKSSKKYTPKAPARRNRQEAASQSSQVSQPGSQTSSQRDGPQIPPPAEDQAQNTETNTENYATQPTQPSSSTPTQAAIPNEAVADAQTSSGISQTTLSPKHTRSVDRSTTSSRKRQRVGDESGHTPQTRSATTSSSHAQLPTPEPTQARSPELAHDESRETQNGWTEQGAAPQSNRQRVAARVKARKQARQEAEGRAAQQITTAAATRRGGRDLVANLAQASAVSQSRPSSVNTRTTRSSEQRDLAPSGSNTSLPQEHVLQDPDNVSQTGSSSKRKRGRPKKNTATVPVTESHRQQSAASPSRPSGSLQTSDVENREDGMQQDDAQASKSNEQQPKRKRKTTSNRKNGAAADSEIHKIDAGALSMNDLSKESKRGKTSGLEARMQNIDWGKVIAQRKAAEREALERAAAAQEAQQHGDAATADEEEGDYENPAVQGDDQAVNERLERAEAAAESARYTGPRLKLVDGQMVVDESTRTVDRYAENPEIDAATGAAFEEIEEDDITRRVNRQSWLHASRRDPLERRVSNKSDPWTEIQTNSFYDALRMFGTDFYIISRMFAGKTRRHIKLKFNREEKANPDRVRSALLGGNVPMDMKVYEQRTGREEGYYKDPEILKRELAEADEQQRAEIEKQKEEEREAARKKMEAARERQEAAKRGRRGRKKDANAGNVDLGEHVEEMVEAVA